ncbi:tetratricopeptide repeat protein [Williamsia sp.]|uniref:tetratricopeptide repeat protein n=1 Tax=Williamsia sp. TaxID=1872085 RepID=UPI001A31C395|nr:tetratricopeptide repeat protein [Williamsia sp.]MBJ7289499.1 tetratricopeptide repeat protein [Williamsia sp.]
MSEPRHDAAPDTWEERIQEFWCTVDLEDRQGAIDSMRRLVAERPPDDPDARFEMGGAYDSCGYEEQAAAEYAAARAHGLRGPRLAQLNIQQGSTLRNIGMVDEAVTMLRATEPDPSIGDARAVFLALALRDAGEPDEALRVALEALIPHLPRYRRSATAYARALTDPGDEGGFPHR